MQQLWVFIVVGLTAGGAYGLAAVGVVTVYRGSGVLNLAHGAVGMAGTYVFWMCYHDGAASHGMHPVLARWPVVPAMAMGIGAGALIGLLVYAFVMFPLRNATELARVIATLGVLLVLQNVAQTMFPSDTSVVPRFLGRGSFTLFGAPFRYDSAVVLALCIVLAIALTLLFRFTRLGLSASALQVGPVAASTLGISPHPVGILTWTLGGALAAVAGILVVPAIGLSPTQLTLLIIYALAASLLGRFRNYGVAVTAAIGMGVAESVMTLHDIAPWIRLSTPFVVILIALVVGGTAVPGRGFAEARVPRVGDGRIRPRKLAVWVGIGVFFALGLGTGWSGAVTNAAIAALVSLSIVIVTGYAGQITLATFGVMGIGALLAAHTAGTWGWGYEASILVGIVAGALTGLLVGLPATRVRGIDLTVVTLGFGIVVANAVLTSPTFIGQTTNAGFAGIEVPSPKLFGLHLDPAEHPGRFAILCVLVLTLASVGLANFRRSAGGRRLLAVRANERGAAALGISVGGAKVAAFTLGGAVAGLAGALTVFRTRTVTFSSFDVFRSIFALAFTIVSGVGFVAGATYTGVISNGGLVSYLFRNVSQYVDQILAIGSGLIVIQIMLQSPDGIIAIMKHQGESIVRAICRRADPGSTASVAEAGDLANQSNGEPIDSGAVWDGSGATELRVDGVTLDYGTVRAIDGVSIELHAGEVLGVIGPNGAGKTSLIDSITGFARPTSGRICLRDEDVTDWSIRRRARAGLGRTFQNLELFTDLTVRENLLVASDRRHVRDFVLGWVRPRGNEIDGVAAQAIHILRLDGLLDRDVRDLPQGTQRLVAVARALAAGPRVLCLDEPAAGLVESERESMNRAIRALVRELDIAVLIVEHNVDVVVALCDQLVVLDFGRVIAAGVPSEVLASDAVRSAYLGALGSHNDGERPANLSGAIS